VPEFYLDSSALAKRYIQEVGSAWVRRVTDRDSGNVAVTVSLSGPELIAAVVRRARGGHIRPADARRAVIAIRQDLRSLLFVVGADSRIVNQAMDIAESHGLRGYDAVHVAAALAIRDGSRADGVTQELTFVSADQEQLSAAAAEGLVVADPQLHR
jgi:uncharacterized protein